jgi:RHH-type transcriptional regulator, proline utilization regulon repressor / proline dehydrogenase / delta 1-pyrroline-5-carboxylate dehydrogenase
VATGDEGAAAAVELATRLLSESTRRRPRAERRRLARMARMVDDPEGKALTLALTDQVLRIHVPDRSARRFHDVVADLGVPAFPGPVDRLALRLGTALAPRLPGVVMPLVAARIRREAGGVVIPAEPVPLARHIARRRAQGIRLNINVLGEAILGEDEASRRADAVRAQLQRPDVDYVSVKISSVYSQVSSIAFDHTVERVLDRLRPLYAEAASHDPPKFVNLDMEEYRDLALTMAVFRAALDDHPALPAGVVLQAYLPDSVAALDELCDWAASRPGPVKVRIVKGANLAMEQVDAELHGWPQAPFTTKAEVDANYLRMLDAALASGLRIGVATHNLFDVAWALVVGGVGRVELEMLEGMAEGQALAARAAAGDMLLYAPVARRDDVESSIAYLARRLDENTAPDNYLRHVFSLAPGSAAFVGERDRFLAAVEHRLRPVAPPRRTQDRSQPTPATDPDAPFANEPDTDFALGANRVWLANVLAAALETEVPVVVDCEEQRGPAWADGIDPSHPGRVLYRAAVADRATVERAVAVAEAAGRRWAAVPASERSGVLARVADTMAAGRGEALAAMVRDAGKTVAEADPEVSEAIDFARYYARSTLLFGELAGVEVAPLGPVVVVPPWNFPYSIPAGGILAALAAGNPVILKPAPETVLTAWVLARHCWAGGVPRDVLQFVPCPEDDVGRRLITHPAVAGVVLTGAWQTARLFQGWRPDLRLHAETSGKNAIVVTQAADLDAAVRDLVRSAFGSAGQKCSAASLAIVEQPVLDEGAFLRRLADATRSLRVGPADDLTSTVGPLIRPPTGPLERALTTLDAGESWLVQPRMVGGNPHLWSPGVKVGVRDGSWFHQTECFGPVLGVMAARDLDEAIRMQNATPYGLTAGIHSLDHREIDRWVDRVEAGNLYVNRHITGAIVRRQPFGGWKRSSVGPGAKAGGPNQVLGLTCPRQVGQVSLEAAGRSFSHWRDNEFAVARDPSGLRAEANVFRYLPWSGPVVVRVAEGVADLDVELVLLAAGAAGVHVEVSSPVPRSAAGAVVTVEDDHALIGRLGAVSRLRALGGVTEAVRRAAADADVEVDDRPPVADGRVELARWYREQAVSVTLHRYGNTVDRRSPTVPEIVRRAVFGGREI